MSLLSRRGARGSMWYTRPSPRNRQGFLKHEKVSRPLGASGPPRLARQLAETKKALSGKQRSQPPLEAPGPKPRPASLLPPQACILPPSIRWERCKRVFPNCTTCLQCLPIAQPGSCGFTDFSEIGLEKEHTCLSVSACEGEGGRVRRCSAPRTARQEPHPAEQSRHHPWTTDLGPIPAELLAGRRWGRRMATCPLDPVAAAWVGLPD